MGGRLAALLFAVLLVFACASYNEPDFSMFADELKFGDEQITDAQTLDTMKVPKDKLRDWTDENQLRR